MNAGATLTIQSLTDQISDLGEYLSTWLDVATDIDCLSCHTWNSIFPAEVKQFVPELCTQGEFGARGMRLTSPDTP